MRKKTIALLITCIMAFSLFAIPVSAATSSFSGSTGTMNSLNGSPSASWPISSGSISSANAKVSGITVNVTVSSGSSAFTLYVVDPNGNYATRSVSSSGAQTFSEFNNSYPGGSWKIYIVTKGTVSTATARMTVNYTY